MYSKNDTTAVVRDSSTNDDGDVGTKRQWRLTMSRELVTISAMARATDAFYEGLGRRIQQLRKKRGLTQEQLGARLVPQVTRASIANIESGKQRVLTHSLAQVAEALEVSADDLIRERSVPADQGLRQQVAAQMQNRLSPEDLQRLTRKLGLDNGGTTDDETTTNPDGPKDGRGAD